MSQYYGPAGIFSTDNPVSDAMQIAEEEGPEDEWYEDGLWDDDWPVDDIIHGVCPECYWWDHELFWEDDPTDLELAKDRLREKHSRERPECSGELEFG